jgi:glycosyl transferase family 25
MKYMRIFVINLKRSLDRRRNIEGQLNALGLPFEISEGVDALNFTPAEHQAYADGLKRGTHQLPPGLFGSSWAHIKVYEKILQEKIPQALVLEDDIYISPVLTRILSEPWVQQPFWDFVHLGYIPASWPGLRKWFAVAAREVRAHPRTAFKTACKIFPVIAVYVFEIVREFFRARLRPGPVRFGRSLYLGDGYLVSLDGARKLMKIAYPIHYTGDQLFNCARRESGLRFYGYCPPPISPNDHFPSETGYSAEQYEKLKTQRS